MLENKKPIIIFDTDMDTDCDDAGALAMLTEAHLAGKIELIGIIADAVSTHAAAFCEVMIKHYGLDLPIGTIFANDYRDTQKGVERFARYRAHQERLITKGMVYNRKLSLQLNKSDTDYPAAKNVYRSLLAGAPDGSVTVLCVGLMTAVAEALMTEGDEACELSGVELFKRKVKCVITMGIPENDVDFNWGMDAYASSKFFELCPVPIYISGEGEDIITGDMLSSQKEKNHPLRRAYEVWTGKEHCGRSSWDLVASLAAIEPNTRYLTLNDIGTCTYSEEKNHIFIANDTKTKNKRITPTYEKKITEGVLNAYMLGKY